MSSIFAVNNRRFDTLGDAPVAGSRPDRPVTRASSSVGRRRSSDRKSSLVQTIAPSSPCDSHPRKSVRYTRCQVSVQC